MVKTKFKPDIHKNGSENGSILRMIASHNDGKELLSIPDFISFASITRAIYPSTQGNLRIERDESEERTKFHVSEDGGKTFTLTVEEVVVYELEPLRNPDDLRDINI